MALFILTLCIGGGNQESEEYVSLPLITGRVLFLKPPFVTAALVPNCVSPVLCGSIALGTIIHEETQAPRLQTSAGAAGF